jgi:hypothetical protein
MCWQQVDHWIESSLWLPAALLIRIAMMKEERKGKKRKSTFV